MLAPCKSIHTFGMRSYLDIAFLDASACIVASERNVPPARIRTFRQAVAVLERRSNPQLDWPREGERIEVDFKERIRKEGIR